MKGKSKTLNGDTTLMPPKVLAIRHVKGVVMGHIQHTTDSMTNPSPEIRRYVHAGKN
jgi:hypothetical protein